MPYTKPDPGEEVVISGISGRFPDCRTVEELRRKLMAKQDLITDDKRWDLDSVEVPTRVGKIPDLEKFDALFFGIHYKQSSTMDPMHRMILEHSYEAILDAGINPGDLRGKIVAVVIGMCQSETERSLLYDKVDVAGPAIVGVSKAMLSNRVSYFLDLHGPSYTVDTACSSSLFAVEQGYKLMMQNECEAALVGGANLCLHPNVSLNFNRLGVLSKDGRCKSFDADADGYARSDAAAMMLLQRAKDAKRVYATVVHAKTNCDGYKDEGITFPSSKLQKQLLQEFYEECKIPPTVLSFMEAHGTGTKVGDPEEISAIDEVFCKGRTESLKIGSVKSNLGHTEPASGICSIIKVLLAMESGYISPNIHYHKQRDDLRAITEGRLQVVTEPTPWEGGYVGINSFGFGGANAHILLKSNPKKKVNNGAPNDDLPRLVVVSGRTEEAVSSLLNAAERAELDVEYIHLLNDIHVANIQNHMYRGYTIVGSKISKTPTRAIEEHSGATRPVCFVFSGMGSQWTGMGKALMRFPIFAKAIKKCDAVLKPRGLDIVDIITNDNKNTFDNILNSFVGIAAIQIGLVDLITSVGIVPDNIIGHSVGELGCAYADGCFTAEQMVLSAYARGLASIETELIFGSMAAIGLGYKQIKDLCPPDIDVACHNSGTSCTISGPADSIKAFVEKLQSQKIFAREVASSNIAYHSRYIAAAGPKLLAYLKQVIPEPKPRSEKWISSSVPRNKWSTPEAKLSSAEYHTNNLLSPVLFEEASPLIPEDAITIEIAPHGLLQAILKRSLGPRVSNVPLTLRGHSDNAEFFLQALGKLYNLGLQQNLANIYPPVILPVSRGTPMISPHVKWEHSANWYVPKFAAQETQTSAERHIGLSNTDSSYQFMSDHIIDGRNLVPGTGYITLVWETLALIKGKPYISTPVVFEGVKFVRAATIPKEGAVHLTVIIQKGSGSFEILEADSTVVTGKIRLMSNAAHERIPPHMIKKIEGEETLEENDIYKELKIRGYDYQGLFKSLRSASIDGSKGHIVWMNNWTAFMDTMLQLRILQISNRALYVPTSIQKLVIDIKSHSELLSSMPDQVLPAYVYKNWNVIVSGGIEIHGLQANSIARRKPARNPVLEAYRFIAHRDNAEVSLEEMAILSIHLALETQMMTNVKVVELVEDADQVAMENLISPLLARVLGDLPLIQPYAYLAAPTGRYQAESLPSEVTVVNRSNLQSDNSVFIAVGYNLLTDKKKESLKQLLSSLKNGGFLLSEEQSVNNGTYSHVDQLSLDVILEKRTGKNRLLLLRKRQSLPKKTDFLFVNNNEFSWLEKLKQALKMEAERQNNESLRLILVAQGDTESGILGLVNCLRKEPGGEIVRTVMVQDKNAPKFSLENSFYAKQLELDLPINVFQENSWGSYRHLPLPPENLKLVRHAYIDQKVRGDLSSFCWLEGPIDPTNKNQELVYIAYGAINFKDVMLATGRISEEAVAKSKDQTTMSIGFEYSGVTSTGRRVMGLIIEKAISNLCLPMKNFTWEVPNGWSLEDAATVPCVYSTSYYALYLAGNMKKGDKVLIHAGSGGVGQAAIHLALAEGCEVFTTVGTPEKRRFIKEMFPSIDDSHIGNSRNTSFEQLIMDQTGGRGVDIVLNSLAEDKLLASVRCLARGGHFLEIGKYDLFSNNPLGMQVFMKEISFKGIMLDYLLVEASEIQQSIGVLLADGIKKGVVKPITRKVFPKEETESALRYVAAAKHIGKVLIKMCGEGDDLATAMPAYPHFHCSSNRSYIIIGGLGGLGLEVADWLCTRGLDHLTLVSRNGVKTGYQKMRIELWKSKGVNVQIICGKDCSKRADCEFILKAAEKSAPVEGIFNLAVQLKDALCVNQTAESFEESMKPKARITKRLDELSRKICPQLRHFVIFSSVSCGRGTAGQSNYGFANSVMERICERRVAEGLPGLAIEWGAIGEVGLVANMQEDGKEISISGTLPQKVSSCMEVLEKFLVQDQPVVSSMVVGEKSRSTSVTRNAVEAVARIMGITNLKAIRKESSLAELGMDSLVAVEIKQTLEREFDLHLTASEIRYLSFAKLMEMSTEREASIKELEDRNHGPGALIDVELLFRMLNEEITVAGCTELSTGSTDGTTNVFFIPGIDGNNRTFAELAKTLKQPAACLFLPYHDDNTTVHGMADTLLPHILERSKARTKITIIAYSFGALIGVEIVRRLETKGFSVRLILIDGSPDYLKTLLLRTLTTEKEEDVQNDILTRAINMICPANARKDFPELSDCKTWEEKVDVFVSKISAFKGNTSIEYRKRVTTAFYRRLGATRSYDFSSLPPISTPITLFIPTIKSGVLCNADYGLHKVTRGTVTIHEAEGDHRTILSDKKLAALINDELAQ